MFGNKFCHKILVKFNFLYGEPKDSFKEKNVEEGSRISRAKSGDPAPSGRRRRRRDHAAAAGNALFATTGA